MFDFGMTFVTNEVCFIDKMTYVVDSSSGVIYVCVGDLGCITKGRYV